MKTVAPGLEPSSRRPWRLFAALLLSVGTLLAAPPAARAQNTGTLTTLYTIPAGLTGSFPNGLLQGSDGNFYGTTTAISGPNGNPPYGTVFRLTPAGVFTTIHNFNGTDGTTPQSELIQGSDGDFYGTSPSGGDAKAGTVFRVTSAGVLTRLHSFDFSGGYTPSAALVQGSDGNFYGTTVLGGTGNRGTVFRISSTGEFATLCSFTGDNPGANPVAALTQGSDGNFYGTTISGGVGGHGTVFRVTPTGEFTTLHAFNGSDGDGPQGGLVQGSDGNFYGAVRVTDSFYKGNVFRMTPAGAVTVLYRFSGQDGEFSKASLTLGRDGNFYGSTYYGGPEYNSTGSPGGYGTLFQITPAGRLTMLYHFGGGSDGGLPKAVLTLGRDGNFYSATNFGGSGGNGTLYRLTVNPPPAFFTGSVALDNGVYYLSFSDGRYFGYYSFLQDAHYIYHQDMGFEYVFDANDGQGGVYLYDFASKGFFYTSPGYGFPYLYDFTLRKVLYYFPDPDHPGRYNTNGVRYFYLFNGSSGEIISK